jgi:uncharacterized protein YidB (DUF937 family)
MGLLDVLNGMRNGPRGGQTSSGGMSPITMAILALLAYKGIKHLGGAQAQQAPQVPQPSGNPARVPDSSNAGGGGLGDILGGLLGGGAGPGGRGVGAPGGGGLSDILGGLLGGGGAAPGGRSLGAAPGGGGLGDLLKGGLAGSVLAGGLGSLVDQFQRSGQGQAADSWVSRGPNRDISEGDLAKSIGNDDLDALAHHTGLSRGELLSGLRRELPGAIDDLTPDGRVPSPQEIEERV